MNFLLGYVVYIPVIVAGGLLVHQLWSGNQPAHLLFKLGLGAGIGLGLTSLISFLFLLFTNSLSTFFTVQILLLACGLVLTWRNWKSSPIFPAGFSLTRLQKVLLGVFGVVLLVSISAYFIWALMTPNGRFDAWMIYNRAARFIYRDPLNWRDTLSPQMYWLFHPDYPLLIPVNVAGAWSTLGSEIMRAPQAQSAYFLFGIFCILMGAIAFLRTNGQALLAGITLLAMPVFLYTAGREEADIPVAFYMLATLSLLLLYHKERRTVLIALAGLTTGLAAWTKNEGVLFLITGSLAWVLLLYRHRELRGLTWFALGLSFPLAIIVYFKLFLAPPNDLFASASSANLMERLVDIERFSIISERFYNQILVFGGGQVSVIILLIVYGLIVGRDKSQNNHQPIYPALMALFLQLAGYFLIYLLTPHDIHWHLRTSLYRLFIHIFPSALFILFASISDPETIFAETQKPSISRQF